MNLNFSNNDLWFCFYLLHLPSSLTLGLAGLARERTARLFSVKAGKMKEKEDCTIKEVWDSLTYEQRLAATAYVFQKICEHARSGGTYRNLIYDRLGFDQDAYSALYPEGMLISNELSLNKKEKRI